MEDAISDGVNNVGKQIDQFKDGVLVHTHRSLSKTAEAIGLANPSNGGATHIKEACEGKIKVLKGFTFAYHKTEGA